MIKIYILYILLNPTHGGHPMNIVTQEHTTIENCEHAAKSIKSQTKRVHSVYCVLK